jgi:hypothetical protein
MIILPVLSSKGQPPIHFSTSDWSSAVEKFFLGQPISTAKTSPYFLYPGITAVLGNTQFFLFIALAIRQEISPRIVRHNCTSAYSSPLDRSSEMGNIPSRKKSGATICHIPKLLHLCYHPKPPQCGSIWIMVSLSTP